MPNTAVATPYKLTPEVQAKIVTAIRAGNYIETSAAYAGISKETLYMWLRHGAKGRRLYRAFTEAVTLAMAEAEVRDVAMIAKASEKEWTAAAWRLERKFPDRWGRRERAIEINTGSVSIGWTPLDATSASPTRPVLINESSTTPLQHIALGPASSSATDDLESLS